MIARRISVPLVLLIAVLTQFLPLNIFAAKPVIAATYCDWAQFIADVTVPDGAAYAPGTTFTKTWRLKNIGTCTWTTSYSLVFASGNQLGASAAVSLPSSVAPGQTVDISVNMTAPGTNGHYKGYWQLRNSAGVLFGIGSTANKTFWVEINVFAASTGYDFVANMCSAQWISGAGVLPCPGTDGDAKGFVLKVDNPKLENGVTDTQPGLLTFPQGITDGYIQGIYPAFTVQSGDRFQSIVNCQYGATSCYVTFRLDYQIGSGPIRTFWMFREKYEGMYYRTDVDLSSLAGQNVKFILTVLAYGSPTGDRALWGAPHIFRSGGAIPTTITPVPGCDKAQFIADVTVPDGATYTPGVTFAKIWRLKNIGTCTWTTSYSLVFASGNQMGGPAAVNFPSNVAPGNTVDLSVNLTAPSTAGSYRGYWQLRNAAGVLFGLGATAYKPFWVDIKVSGTSPAGYDFVANMCSAQWVSGAGVLPCPGPDVDPRGFVFKLDNPKLENGATDTQPGLLTFPQDIYNGYIQGIYPDFAVQSGDRFQSIVNCQYNATSCYVNFRLDYRIGSGPIQTLWSFREKYEGMYYFANVDLSSLSGQNVKFILTVLAYGSPAGDRALWGAPRIVRAVSGSVPTTVTPTSTWTTTATLTPTATTTITQTPTATATTTATSTSTSTATPTATP